MFRLFNHVSQLLRYLRPTTSAYHVRAVNLIWSLERLSTQHHVESVIAESVSFRQPNNLQDACEAFGVLWRLTGTLQMSAILPIPISVCRGCNASRCASESADDECA